MLSNLRIFCIVWDLLTLQKCEDSVTLLTTFTIWTGLESSTNPSLHQKYQIPQLLRLWKAISSFPNFFQELWCLSFDRYYGKSVDNGNNVILLTRKDPDWRCVLTFVNRLFCYFEYVFCRSIESSFILFGNKEIELYVSANGGQRSVV